MSTGQATISVVQIGLGPIGNRVTEYLSERRGLELVAAVDLDPAKVGRDAGEIAGLEPLGVKVTSDLAEALAKRPKVAVLTTTSKLEAATEQMLPLLEARCHVVSTCEELSYPWRTREDLARRIDEAAKAAGVAVLGTGVNPGFLMDFLPVVLSGVCRDVRTVTVERIQNAQFRRLPFQKKIGAGLAPDEFKRREAEGTLRHVGLTESMHLIAAAFGWELSRTEDILEPVIAEHDVATASFTVKAGQALGVSQTGRGFVGRKEVISLVFRASIGQENPRDRIIIDGDPMMEAVIPGGVNGDVATCAITVNAIPAVCRAESGLRTMLDMPPATFFEVPRI